MIVDAETRTDDWFRDRILDICIIGTGPAGITLARSLGKRGLSVGLFEAGGFDLSGDSQDLYKGATAGQPCLLPPFLASYPQQTRTAVLPLPRLPGMPQPCAGPPKNAFCP